MKIIEPYHLKKEGCFPEDLNTISEFMEITYSKVFSAKFKYRTIKLTSYVQHALGITSGIMGLHAAPNNNKITILMYIFVMIYCATNGFQASRKAKELRSEYDAITTQYKSFENILESAKPAAIHKIAETIRQETQDIAIENSDIPKILSHILIKYENNY